MAKTARKRKSATRKATATHLPDASAAKRRAVVRDVNKVLAAHGVRGTVAELHLMRAAAESGRVVCRKQPDGRIVCREE
jgi:hypothetical protein